MKMQDFMQKIKEKKLKRSDWLILVLAGILILIIALPTDTKGKKQAEETKENLSKETDTMEASKDEIERKLEAILEKIDGAGEVKVMITYQDSGTQVVEKDKNTSANSVEESDSTGGGRSTKEQQLQESTVYDEADAGNTPFVSKELLPKVEGILIVASGGDNQKVKQNISEAVLALFQVEAHRIKIVKMSGLEDSK
ncbi:MAG TPA: stage III sporulation protein AG [Roseburia sp.]|nr:stage III sporulation protein AG [Roseburia sp.]